MTYGNACRELLRRGCNVVWHLGLWASLPPEPLTDEYIARNENNSDAVADWEVSDDNELVAVARMTGKRLRVQRGV